MSKRGRKFTALKKSNQTPAAQLPLTQQGLNTLEELDYAENFIKAKRQIAIQRGLQSTNAIELLSTQQYIKGIEQKQDVQLKSVMVDPMDVNTSFGYKDKPFSLSYDMLRGMARTHIIKAIIKTRKSQVLNFCDPQTDRYSTGFVIDRKDKWRSSVKDKPLSPDEQLRAEKMTKFILDCGNTNNYWSGDTFETFITKFIDDSLTLDQGTFEVTRDRAGRPIQFLPTDAATFRIADSYADDSVRGDIDMVNGYKPAYVQVINGQLQQQFYPWEMCFGVRNPSTDIRTNGYGRSELEDMIQLITSILNADQYNGNFFKVGSSPQGIISYSGNINQNTVNDFRQSWQAMVSGVANSHKIPIINADKITYTPTHIPNKDMEFSKFQEFLIKCGCAMYTIDPSEIGFPMSGSADGAKGLGGDGGTKEKLKYSKDKGLKPLLKALQLWLNKYIVWPLEPEFELRFVGIDDEDDKGIDLDQDVKKVGSFMTVNEIRAKHNLEALDGMDIILNPIASQATMMKMQGDAESNAAIADENGDNEPSNPFLKSLSADIGRLLAA